MLIKKIGITAAIVATLVVGGAAVGASAGTHSASVSGSVASSAGTTVYNQKNDYLNETSYSAWRASNGITGELVNGNKNTIKISTDTGLDISAVQACRTQTLRPTLCSTWK